MKAAHGSEMTHLDKFFGDTRRVTDNAQSATTTAVAGGEMLKAAGDVIAARLEIMAAGLANPGKADMTEISLMSSEKVEALSASAATLARNFGDLGGRLSQSAMEEVGFASRAVTALSAAPTPAAFASVTMPDAGTLLKHFTTCDSGRCACSSSLTVVDSSSSSVIWPSRCG